MRKKALIVGTSSVKVFGEFELFGEKFIIVCKKDKGERWYMASSLSTGMNVSTIASRTIEEARAQAMAAIVCEGEEKMRACIALFRSVFGVINETEDTP